MHGHEITASNLSQLRLWQVIVLLALITITKAAYAVNAAFETGTTCNDRWYQSIEDVVSSGDGRGHGPDVGSDEWKSVIEFKLAIRDNPDVPQRDSEAWCRYIDKLVTQRYSHTVDSENRARNDNASGPSYDCSKVEAGSIEALICNDETLSVLDRKLAAIYDAALKKAVNQRPPLLKAEQRGWIKGRNDCWKADDTYSCVRQEYDYRISELQAQYRLVANSDPVFFICDTNPANEVVVTFFRTEPPTLIAEYGDSVSVMHLVLSASGSKYQGRNETFWEHQGQAMITWGYGAKTMQCVRK